MILHQAVSIGSHPYDPLPPWIGGKYLMVFLGEGLGWGFDKYPQILKKLPNPNCPLASLNNKLQNIGTHKSLKEIDGN
jgi:hypothetical protein